jgi:hypothetical protein
MPREHMGPRRKASRDKGIRLVGRLPMRTVFGTAEQIPKAKRYDHLLGAKGCLNAAALHAGAGPLWGCEGAFDAPALLAAGVRRVVALFGVQGWRWDWVREVREWCSTSTLTPRGSRRGASSPAKRRCGASGGGARSKA